MSLVDDWNKAVIDTIDARSTMEGVLIATQATMLDAQRNAKGEIVPNDLVKFALAEAQRSAVIAEMIRKRDAMRALRPMLQAAGFDVKEGVLLESIVNANRAK